MLSPLSFAPHLSLSLSKATNDKSCPMTAKLVDTCNATSSDRDSQSACPGPLQLSGTSRSLDAGCRLRPRPRCAPGGPAPAYLSILLHLDPEHFNASTLHLHLAVAVTAVSRRVLPPRAHPSSPPRLSCPAGHVRRHRCVADPTCIMTRAPDARQLHRPGGCWVLSCPAIPCTRSCQKPRTVFSCHLCTSYSHTISHSSSTSARLSCLIFFDNSMGLSYSPGLVASVSGFPSPGGLSGFSFSGSSTPRTHVSHFIMSDLRLGLEKPSCAFTP